MNISDEKVRSSMTKIQKRLFNKPNTKKQSPYSEVPRKITLRKLKRWIFILCCIVAFILSPFFQVVKSYVVMSVYSHYHKVESEIYKEGIRINMPSGLSTFKRDYYPFVMTYDTTQEFSNYMGESIELVVLYNFGAMRWLKGSSLMFDKNSDYYSGFYGAYVARYTELNKQYGMNSDQSLHVEEIMEVTNFDLKQLVLSSMGCEEPFLEYQINSGAEPRYTIIDGQKYQTIDAVLTMSGMSHEFKEDYMAYIQYGRPPKKSNSNEQPELSFETIEAFGRIYIYFDKDTKISYFFYIIAPTIKTLVETEENFILKSTLSR